jgi:pimeloyl-ACP methyl ester carboxylesterase
MPTLDVPGAHLYYETFGGGPLLLFIQGAEGRGSVFHDVAKFLSSYYTVACWDRRGYSLSFLVGPQELSSRMYTDADDAQRLITHLSPDAPAIVFGSSSGAVVAQHLLARHPDSVKSVIAFEPPCFTVLPQQFAAQAAGLLQQIYDTYRARGPQTAMEIFADTLGLPEEAHAMKSCMDSTKGDETRANTMFWFEFELLQYTSGPVPLDKLNAYQEKYIPAAGVDSGDGPTVGPVAIIAQRLGKEIVRFPGGHIGYMVRPMEFAKTLREMLKPGV